MTNFLCFVIALHVVSFANLYVINNLNLNYLNLLIGQKNRYKSSQVTSIEKIDEIGYNDSERVGRKTPSN